METEQITTATKTNVQFDLEEMMKAGLHFGHKTSKTHPQMLPYIQGIRNTVHIINLEKTVEKLQEALEFIRQLMEEKKILLLLGTKIQIKQMVRQAAEECGLPYVTERWIGGTFTNFEAIQKRVEYFQELEKKKAGGEIEKYTKLEQLKIDQELQKLEMKFGGIKKLQQLPDAIFVFDLDKNKLAVKEAREKGITVIAISDTNTDPTLADLVIPANDDAISSVQYLLDKVKETILNAKGIS